MWIHVKTTFEHQRALDLKLFLKTFWLTRYIQVDLKNFLASGAFFLERVATDRAMILQEINSRHSSFLTVNQETTQVCRPAGRPGQYFQSPEATFSAVRAQPWVFVLIYAVRLTFPSFADAVSFFCLCNRNLTCKWFEVAANKNHTRLTGRARKKGKLKKKKKKQGDFGLPRKKQKESATEFMMLADYVIPRKKPIKQREITQINHIRNQCYYKYVIAKTSRGCKGSPVRISGLAGSRTWFIFTCRNS